MAMAHHGPAGLFERLGPLPAALLTLVLVVHVWPRQGWLSSQGERAYDGAVYR
jgi:hypothetical protein